MDGEALKLKLAVGRTRRIFHLKVITEGESVVVVKQLIQSISSAVMTCLVSPEICIETKFQGAKRKIIRKKQQY